MLKFFKSRFSTKKKVKQGPRVPPGQRVYAVGDIHGCDDLFAALIEAIEADMAEADGRKCQIVLLGDLVDRGAGSRRVIKLARKWQKARDVRILFGNHEEMFLSSFHDRDTLKHFLRHGGRETMLSYGVERKSFSKCSVDELQALLHQSVPEKDRKFLESFEDMIRIGDYVFVHAGIKPGVPLKEQKKSTLRWIREPFLSYEKLHEAMVVHGHTITDEPEVELNRIGVDTGAYASGRLTALVLQGRKRGFISAVLSKQGSISIEHAKLKA